MHWLVFSTPLNNMLVSWDYHSQYMKIQKCSKPPSSLDIFFPVLSDDRVSSDLIVGHFGALHFGHFGMHTMDKNQVGGIPSNTWTKNHFWTIQIKLFVLYIVAQISIIISWFWSEWDWPTITIFGYIMVFPPHQWYAISQVLSMWEPSFSSSLY